MEPKAKKPKLEMIGALLCNTCPHRKKCTKTFKKNALFIRVIQKEDNPNLCFGGYQCLGLLYNTIPFDKGIDWFWQYAYSPKKKITSPRNLKSFGEITQHFEIIKAET